MAILKLTRAWRALEEQTTIYVILPNEIQRDKKLQVLWLLHGLGDDGSGWIRKTNLEVLTKHTNLVVITPEMNRSFYMNMKDGLPYWDYLVDEVIPEMRNLLPLSTNPKDNFVGGVSMGGFGAFKLAFTHPEWFSAIVPMSSVIDLTELPKIMPDYRNIFGGPGPAGYLEKMAANASLSKLKQLRFYDCVGDQDDFKPSNEQFAAYLKNDLGLNVGFHTSRGGHDWLYWQRILPDVLNWLIGV
ncbi:alpha/beta hydrolase [Lentilactobacillus kefiri]|uniref:alpha/beta hydrolase n=1 Tax=Lentilactobacillus kefiri TaxID=33962 RepID=UPI00345E0DC6